MHVWHAFIYFIKKARGLSSQAGIGARCVKLFESLLVLPLISFVRWSIIRILWRKFVPHCLKVHVQLCSMALIFLGIGTINGRNIFSFWRRAYFTIKRKLKYLKFHNLENLSYLYLDSDSFWYQSPVFSSSALRNLAEMLSFSSTVVGI